MHGCSAANSINWGRLLPQVLYHVSGYLEMARMGHIAFGDPVDLCIPTGNFGNILSAYYAKVSFEFLRIYKYQCGLSVVLFLFVVKVFLTLTFFE